MEPPAPRPLSVGRSLAALAIGLFIALLGLAIGFAQGMVTAPSHQAELVALGIAACGFALALLGLVSLFIPRLRKAAGLAALAAAALLAVLFIIDKIAMTMQLWGG